MENKKILEACNHFKEAMRILDSGPLSFYLEKLTECRDEFFKRCSPFSVGSRVQLVKTPNITKESGWYHCKHFLVSGGLATVKEVDFKDGKFLFSVSFDNETWVDSDNKERPIKTEDRHVFSLDETYFRMSIK